MLVLALILLFLLVIELHLKLKDFGKLYMAIIYEFFLILS